MGARRQGRAKPEKADFKEIAFVYTKQYTQGVRFEWHERKNGINFIKHSVWFEDALSVWTDPNAVEFFDDEHCGTEDRFLRMGHSSLGRLLLVSFTERDSGGTIRIISARTPTPRERRQYEEGL